MTTVRRSLGFAFLERYLIIGLQLLSFTLLARLLTPQQIGLYSVSMALISIAQVIRDFGLANYLIQRETLDADDVGSALGLSILLGGSLFVVVNAAAPFIGNFYNDASLTQIVRIIALNFLILPFNSISIALFRRKMNFALLMRINVSAAVIGTSTTLVLAWAGLGSWSLAWGEIASNMTIAAGALLAGSASALQRPRLTKWRAILSFGGPVTLANIVTSISMDINDLVVGKILNFTQVAIVSRAQGLMNLFNRDVMGTVRGVAYPAFAKANREGAALEQKYVASVTAVTAVAWPFYGFLALFPLEVLRLMFGPQWDESAPLVPLFCLAGAFSATVSLVPTVMLATGNAKLVAMADLIIQPIKAVALTVVVYHYRALFPFAIGFLVMAVVAVPYFYAFKQRCLPSDFPAITRNLG
ncbi:MAG: lipopolysaccharide biosynthesis protein, partial [Rhodoferax sp.]|nr:lipopolysaccharide biosynthesis protein [Rhodoferax sp.]